MVWVPLLLLGNCIFHRFGVVVCPLAVRIITGKTASWILCFFSQILFSMMGRSMFWGSHEISIWNLSSIIQLLPLCPYPMLLIVSFSIVISPRSPPSAINGNSGLRKSSFFSWVLFVSTSACSVGSKLIFSHKRYHFARSSSLCGYLIKIGNVFVSRIEVLTASWIILSLSSSLSSLSLWFDVVWLCTSWEKLAAIVATVSITIA